MAKKKPVNETTTQAKPVRFQPYRTELSINDIRASAYNASEGNTYSYAFLQEQNKKLAKLANQRMRQLRAANLDMFAYDRAKVYLENRGLSRFPITLPDASDYPGIVKQLSELVAFINNKSSTVAGARKTMDDKLKAISDATGTTYTQKQKENMARLLGTDSVSTLLRDIRGNSLEVIEILEELSLQDMQEENRQAITRVIDRYLEGWQPFDNAAWATKSRGLTYDELMDELREVYMDNNWHDIHD